MDRNVKIAAALSVLLGGTVVALIFRHESLQTRRSVPRAAQRLVLRKHAGPPADDQTTPGQNRDRPEFPYTVSAAAPASMSLAAGETATVVRPLDSGEPPPLPRSYPEGRLAATSRWGASIGLHLPPVSQPDGPLHVPLGLTRIHKIVDGDTLEALARRYLGSAKRYREIFEANRDVLPSPRLLPIGAELKIPSADGPAASDSGQIRERPLVPVVP